MRAPPTRLVAALSLAALLPAACATPAQRIERTLAAEGVPPAMARCLGERLDERLTTPQLRELGRVAARFARTDWRGLTIAQAEVLARDLDPTLLAALAGSGFDCLVRSDL